MGLPDIPSGIEKKCNDALYAFAGYVSAIQEEYFAAHGRYWQAIQCADVPEDGAEITPDKPRKPTDQDDDYDDAGVDVPAHSPCALGVDVMNGPEGHGYEVFGIVKIGGKIYRKRIGYGSHAQSTAWLYLPEGI